MSNSSILQGPLFNKPSEESPLLMDRYLYAADSVGIELSKTISNTITRCLPNCLAATLTGIFTLVIRILTLFTTVALLVTFGVVAIGTAPVWSPFLLIHSHLRCKLLEQKVARLERMQPAEQLPPATPFARKES